MSLAARAPQAPDRGRPAPNSPDQRAGVASPSVPSQSGGEVPISIALGDGGTTLLLLLAAQFGTSQADVVTRGLVALAGQVGLGVLVPEIGDEDGPRHGNSGANGFRT